MKAPLNIGLQCIAHVLVDSRQVEPLGIEISSTPLLGFVMLRVTRVSQDFKKPFIARDSADIFRWASPCTLDAFSRLWCDVEAKPLFQFNGMRPAVAEIVKVVEPCSSSHEVTQANVRLLKDLGIIFAGALVGSRRIAKTQPTNLKFVQMVIPPVERGLDRQVKLLQIPIDRYDQTPPSRRLDVVNRHTNLHCVEGLKHIGRKPSHDDHVKFRGLHERQLRHQLTGSPDHWSGTPHPPLICADPWSD